MTQEFVTYEQALALKELGFDEPCPMYWGPEMDGSMHLFCHQDSYFWDAIGSNNSDNAKWVECTAPLKQQAFRWFREKHNLFCEIQVDRTTAPKFCFDIFQYEHFGNYEKIEVEEWFLYRTYEEAEQACLDKLIEIYKNNSTSI